MKLSSDQVEAALYAVEQCIVYRGNDRRRIPREVLKLQQALRIASSCGSEIDDSEQEFGNDLINSAEAARILDCSSKWVWTIRGDLDGRKYGDRWLYPRRTVTDYAENWYRPTRSELWWSRVKPA